MAGVSGREWHGMGWGWVKWGGVRGAGLLTSVDDANIPTWCRHDERNQNISKSGSGSCQHLHSERQWQVDSLSGMQTQCENKAHTEQQETKNVAQVPQAQFAGTFVVRSLP